MDAETIEEFKALTQRYYVIEVECGLWCERNIMPLSRQCETIEDLLNQWSQFSLAAVDDKGRFRDLPGDMGTKKLLEMDRVRDIGKQGKRFPCKRLDRETQEELRSLTDRYYSIIDECDKWCLNKIMPLSWGCKTEEGVKELWGRLKSLINGDLPGILAVHFAFEMVRVRYPKEEVNESQDAT